MREEVKQSILALIGVRPEPLKLIDFDQITTNHDQKETSDVFKNFMAQMMNNAKKLTKIDRTEEKTEQIDHQHTEIDQKSTEIDQSHTENVSSEAPDFPAELEGHRQDENELGFSTFTMKFSNVAVVKGHLHQAKDKAAPSTKSKSTQSYALKRMHRKVTRKRTSKEKCTIQSHAIARMHRKVTRKRLEGVKSTSSQSHAIGCMHRKFTRKRLQMWIRQQAENWKLTHETLKYETHSTLWNQQSKSEKTSKNHTKKKESSSANMTKVAAL